MKKRDSDASRNVDNLKETVTGLIQFMLLLNIHGE